MSRPELRSPMLATSVDEVVSGAGWMFEGEVHGVRLAVVRDDDRVRRVTRNQLHRTSRYPEPEEGLAQLCPSPVADGEVVARDGATASSSRLQPRSALTGQDAIDSDVTVRSSLGDHWMTPDLVDEVGFTEWTGACRLRHRRFLGRRDDEDAAEVVREVPRSAP